MSNNYSYDPLVFNCSSLKGGDAITISITFAKASLLVPLYTFIIYLGAQKWKQQRSFATTSHSDIFTYHQVAFVVFLGLASGLLLCTTVAYKVCYFLYNMTWYGENYFQALTCVEQYLAVVHPIVYMKLRNSRGVRIRNISIGGVWLLTLTSSAFISLFTDSEVPIIFMIPFAVCLVIVSFCCLSVLCVLIRPGPGEGTRVDPSKRRAFHTITAIFVVLLLWLGGILVSYALYLTLNEKPEVRCMIVYLVYWFNLPSGLVLPLLYLHRAGKLSFCCCNNG